jgi:hypothetical protein
MARLMARRPGPEFWRTLVLAALIAAIGLLSSLRALSLHVRRWGEPNIYLNYSHGLVRRGLVGEVIRLLGLPESKLVFSVACWTAGVLTLLLLAWLAARARHLHPAVTMLLLASQFLPTLAYNTGYLDPFVTLLVLLTYLCLARGWLIPAAAAAFVAPFVHEQFIFFMLPVATLAVIRLVRRSGFLPHVVTFGAALVGTLVVLIFDNKQGGAALMQQSPMTEYVIHGMIRDQLGQTLGSSLKYMVGFYATTWKYSLVMVTFMIAPALLMLVFSRSLVKAAPWVVTGLIGPLGLLAVAWDLSRFSVMAVFGLFVVLAVADSPLFHEPLPAAEVSAASFLVGGLLALGYAMVPFIYSYPQYGYTPDTLQTWVDKFVDRSRKWPYRP